MSDPKQFGVELKKRLQELDKAQKIGQKTGLIDQEESPSLETLEEIKKYLRRGDFIKVAAKAKLTVLNVRKILIRPNSKRYQAVLNAAREIAKYNISLGLKPL